MPGLIEFDGGCLIVLKQTLLATKQEEGCALLIGNEVDSSLYTGSKRWRIKVIWPCLNVWEPGIYDLRELKEFDQIASNQQLSKEKRFVIDPREQLHAQKWSREKKWQVLGCAHSHPNSAAIPSRTDIHWSSCSSLMVILGQNGSTKAWWVSASKKLQPIKLANHQ